MKKRKKWWLLPAAAVLVLLVLAGGVLAVSRLHWEWWFRIGDGLRRAVLQAELSEVSPETETVSRVSLEADSRWRTEQSLLLVNASHPLAADFTAEITEYRDSGVWMNACMTGAYAVLSDELRAGFEEPMFVSSAYRTAEEQAEAIELEGALAAGIGESEHQAGLAVDVYVPQFGGRSFLKTALGQYVNRNAWQYGFTIRYPYGKAGVTGIGYEPWHLRYVGQPHAEILYKNSLTLEEYVAGLTVGKFYRSGAYLISRQTAGEQLVVPVSFQSAVSSEDNTGCVILTFRVAD